MDYITKIKLKNAKNDYDIYYPVTKTSALILDEGIENIAKQTAPYIARNGYDYNINELVVNKIKYDFTPLWSGNAAGHLDTSGYPTNTNIYSIDTKYNLSHFNVFAAKITAQNSNDMGYIYCNKRQVSSSSVQLIWGATTDSLSVMAPNKNVINTVLLRIIDDSHFTIDHVGSCLLESRVSDNGIIYSYGNITNIYGVC